MSNNQNTQATQKNFIISQGLLLNIINTLEQFPYKDVEGVLVPLKHVPNTLGNFEETLENSKIQAVENYKKSIEEQKNIQKDEKVIEMKK